MGNFSFRFRASPFLQGFIRIVNTLANFLPATFAAIPSSRISGFAVLFFASFDFFSDIKRVQYRTYNFNIFLCFCALK